MEEERKAKTIYFSKEEDLVLLDKLDSYIKLTKSNPDVTSETTTGIVRNLIKDFLEGKVLTKDFIELEEPYYFNKKELLEKGTVKAVPEEPNFNPKDYFYVQKTPNNLDSFNVETKTYSYGVKANVHKGIFIYHEHQVINSVYYAVPLYLVFIYDAEAKEIAVNKINPEDINIFIKSEEDVETINSLIDAEEYFQKNFKFINEDGVEEVNLEVAFSKNELGVIKDYLGAKAIDLLVKYNVDVLGASEETSSEIKASINLTNPVEDLVNSNAVKDKKIRTYEKKESRLLDLKKRIEDLENENETGEQLQQEQK